MGTLIRFPTRPVPEQGRYVTDVEPEPRPSPAPAHEAGLDTAPGAVTRARASVPTCATTAARATATARAPRPVLLWREAVGHELRVERTRQGRTLTDVADRAGVSTQYLSEVERGRKEPSSEVIEAVGGALSLTLLDLTTRVSGSLARSAGTGPRLMAA